MTAWLPLAVPLLLAGGPDEILWEKNRGFTDTGFTYFQGSRCEPGGSCPREMGWQGNDLTLTFALPPRGEGYSEVRFEVVVERVLNPVTVSVSAGPPGNLRAAGSLRLASAGIHRLLLAAADLRWGGLNEVRLRGDNPVGSGQPGGVRWTALGLYRNLSPPPAISDGELLDDTQWRACRYFYEQTLPGGLVLDTGGGEASSAAAIGFGATAMAILADRAGSAPGRWTISAAAARARALEMLDSVLAIQSRQAQSESDWGTAGLPYHILDAQGRRAGTSEVSTIDGALLLAGLLTAGEHFGSPLAEKARTIFRQADFSRFYQKAQNRYSHGWKPGSGFLATTWDRPGDEALLVCLLSLAQDPADPDRLRALYGYPRVSESYGGVAVVRSYFGSLFTYTFAHLWLPFECLGKDRPQSAGLAGVPAVDWWENSLSAVEASRRYHRDQAHRYPALGAAAWGASACYRADRPAYFGENGAEPSEAAAAFDGTLPPHGAIMSLFLAGARGERDLAANPAAKALRHYYQTRFNSLWCSYGPRSSFDAAGNTSSMVVAVEKGPEALGIEAWRSGRPARDLLSNPDVQAAVALVFERSSCPPPPADFVRGRINLDGEIDLSDPVYLLDFLFRGGPPPACLDSADANDDGVLDLSDAVRLFGFLYLDSAPLPQPFPFPGQDPTPDGLSCG